jgi:hypothetical protein
MSPIDTSLITIRPAYADDDSALARLAALDSAEHAPARPLLLAEVDGELKAALSPADGAVIADPFSHTVELVELLRMHAGARSRPSGLRRRSHLFDGRRRDRTRGGRRRAVLVG